jgi:hypothetical protein
MKSAKARELRGFCRFPIEEIPQASLESRDWFNVNSGAQENWLTEEAVALYLKIGYQFKGTRRADIRNRNTLAKFATAFGGWPVSDLSPLYIVEWTRSEGWANSTAYYALTQIAAFINWAESSLEG